MSEFFNAIGTAAIIIGVVSILIGVVGITTHHPQEPIAVTRQSGFVIEVNNELMILACKYHNIDSDDIRWDTVNDNFVFYRDEHKCHVFTNAFKEYLDSLSIEKTIDTIK